MFQKLIIIDGPMWAGKTTASPILHERLQWSALIGIDKIKWFVSGFSRTKEENRIAWSVLLSMCRTYLEHGITVIIEQGFKTAELMEPYLQAAKEQGIPAAVYQIEAPRSVLMERLLVRPKPALAKEPVTIERIQANLDSYFANKHAGAKIIFDSSVLSADEIVEAILADLKHLE